MSARKAAEYQAVCRAAAAHRQNPQPFDDGRGARPHTGERRMSEGPNGCGHGYANVTSRLICRTCEAIEAARIAELERRIAALEARYPTATEGSDDAGGA